MISAFAARRTGARRTALSGSGVACGGLRARSHVSPEDRTLLRRYREGEAAIPAFLDDYAFLVQGLLDLYETGFAVRHLEAAIRLTDRQIELFDDPVNGGFFYSGGGERSGAPAQGRLRRSGAIGKLGRDP